MLYLRRQVTDLNNWFKKLEESMDKRFAAEPDTNLAPILEKQADTDSEIKKSRERSEGCQGWWMKTGCWSNTLLKGISHK